MRPQRTRSAGFASSAMSPFSMMSSSSVSSSSKHSMIRRGPLIIALVSIIVLPILLVHVSQTELSDEELKSKLRDTSGGHPRVDTGTYQGKLWKTDQTLGRTLLGETPYARCDVHSVMVEEGQPGDETSKNKNKKIINDWIFMEERDAVNVAVYTKEGNFLVFAQRKYAIPGETWSPVGGFIDNEETPFEAARREVYEELGVGSTQTKKQHLWLSDASSTTSSSGGNPFAKKHHGSNKNNKDKDDTNNNEPVVDEYGLLVGAVPEEETSDWVFLGRYRTMANRGGGFLYAYLLRNAVPLIEGGGTESYRSRGDDESQRLLRLSKDATLQALQTGKFQEIKWAATMSLAVQQLQQDSAQQ